jgi:CheY-like chemotaxis protein
MKSRLRSVTILYAEDDEEDRMLDLNMPRMDGREAMAHIKRNPELRRIPVVVLTTSKADQDILKTYDLVKGLGKYWFEIVELPPN